MHEVILVDDHCTDDTVAVAKTLLPRIKVVENTRRPGKGHALQAGVESAIGEIIVALDADGSEDPGEIPLFVGALFAGADYAKGSRFIHGGGTSDMPLLRGDGFEIETMLNIRAFKAGLKINEVPSFEVERIHGIGRLVTFPDGWRVLKTIWRERKAGAYAIALPVSAAAFSDVSRQGALEAPRQSSGVARTVLGEGLRARERGRHTCGPPSHRSHT